MKLMKLISADFLPGAQEAVQEPALGGRRTQDPGLTPGPGRMPCSLRPARGSEPPKSSGFQMCPLPFFSLLHPIHLLKHIVPVSHFGHSAGTLPGKPTSLS